MDNTMIDQKRSGMEAFLSELEEREAQEASMRQFRNSHEYKLSKLNNQKTEGLENCATGVICKIYRDALPMDDDYKAGCEKELDDGFIDTIKRENPNGVYAFLSSCADKGSEPAKMMLEAVNEEMDRAWMKFYEELDEVDPDEIDFGPQSEVTQTAIDKVSSDMDYDQISNIIEQNVQNTVRKEIETQKAEDQKIQDLEAKLSEDDTVNTEEAIDVALLRAGMEKKMYTPSLFNGIMIGKVKEYSESADLDTEHVQKKAFFESVKEYTKLETLSMLNLVKFDHDKINNLTNHYAYGK